MRKQTYFKSYVKQNIIKKYIYIIKQIIKQFVNTSGNSLPLVHVRQRREIKKIT